MLAENFLTAKELGLSEQSHRAHIVVLRKLEREELTTDCTVETIREGRFFSMGNWCYCLRGQVVKQMGRDELFDTPKRKWSDGLLDLYMPPENVVLNMGRITMPQAACALRNYLTTGKAQWEEALAA
jgi:hypothetical protein